MGIEILVKAIDHVHPDPDKDRRGAYKKGYPVVIKDIPNPGWGAKEGLPKFVLVRCEDPTITKDAVIDRIGEWRDYLDFEVLSANAQTATYQVRVWEVNASVSGANALTREKVESYLNKWGGAVDSIAQNEVAFTVALNQMVRSDGFWDIDLIGTKVSFTTQSYDPQTGVGRILVQNVSLPEDNFEQNAIRKIEEKGGTAVSSNKNRVVFEIERGTLLDTFKQETKRRVGKIYCRRRYYFDPADVDTAIAAGGVVTLTKAQLLNKIKDKLAD